MQKLEIRIAITIHQHAQLKINNLKFWQKKLFDLVLRLIKLKSTFFKYFQMKQGLHPASYRYVVFKDMSNGHSFLSRSTAATKETVKWEDGNEYPLIKLEISSTSHPFFTGKNVLVDTAGRIDKFKKKYEKKK